MRCLSAIAAASLLAVPAVDAAGNDPRREPGSLAPLLEGLGTLHFPVTTRSERAQRFIDQGLRLTYAFNHAEARRAFQEAARLDPRCAMAHWGEALVLGPNINDAMPFDRELEAHAAVRRALRLAKHASPRERSYIEALATRYSDRKTRDRDALDRAYADAMAALTRRHPDDLDAATLYAEALMDLTPWDYWTKDGQPKGATLEVTRILESVIARQADHAGALHLHIHIVEASQQPERGLPAADRLGPLMPSAGHLVHMPAHIYIRTGRFAQAAEANVRAIAADESYLGQCRAQGLYPAAYYPHNLHFLWAATTFEGRSAEAIGAARKLGAKLTKEHTCGPASGQDWSATPLYALVRFGRWDEVLNEPRPSEKAFARAMWHYARGVALAAKRRFDEASRELAALEALVADPTLEDDTIGFDPAPNVVRLAAKVVAGEIAARSGRLDEAVSLLRKAVALQDGLRYNEPPEWHHPVRHVLGAVLLQAGRPAEAEAAYREDLAENRENGWALFGLLQSLRDQGKTAEAGEVEARFRAAWKNADIVLTASRF
jgi:tetratricopeptide (TPR) repeat protein